MKEHLIEWLKTQTEAYTAYQRPYRIYTTVTGALNVVIVEWEYQDMEEWERLWEGYYAQQESQAGTEYSYDELVDEQGGHMQLLRLVEQR